MLSFILTYSYRILIFTYIFGYFFQKGHFKGSSEKRTQRQKTFTTITKILEKYHIKVFIFSKVTRLQHATFQKLKYVTDIFLQNLTTGEEQALRSRGEGGG